MKRIVNDMLKGLALKDGKDGRGPHTFRHYFATYLCYVGGMEISDIGFLMGDTPDMIRPDTFILLRKCSKAGWNLRLL
jgi:integrase